MTKRVPLLYGLEQSHVLAFSLLPNLLPIRGYSALRALVPLLDGDYLVPFYVWTLL